MQPRNRSHVLAMAPLASLLLVLSGCSHWRVHQPGPASLISQRNPERVQVVARDSTRLLLDRPQVVGDSLVGTADGARVALALTDIATVSERRTHVLATAGLTYALVAVVGGVVWSQDGWQ